MSVDSTTFWEEAFGPGGKDTLRLLWGAKNFRTSKNKNSTVRSFKLPKGTVKIYEESSYIWTKRYTVFFDYRDDYNPYVQSTFEIKYVKEIVECMTGLTLDL